MTAGTTGAGPDPRVAGTRAVDIIARRLHAAGCRHAFGIPGGEVLAMIDALERAGIRFVLTRHENVAGFMAEGVFSRTGAPGILVATLGPGVANAANVIANAGQDRVPLLVLTGCVDAEEGLAYTHQIFDHAALLGPVVKASLRLGRSGIDTLADKALAIALGSRPGPVHVDLPISLARAGQAPERARPHAVLAPSAPARGPALEEVREWLAQARRPLVVAGLDALRQGAGRALRRFVEEVGAPLVTTYKAKGILPEDHPLALGGAGLSPLADRHLLPLLRAADFILLAGYDPIEMRAGWREPWDPGAQRVVELTPVLDPHFMHDVTRRFVCDVGAGLDALSDAGPARDDWPDGEPMAARAALAGCFGQGEAWGPAAIVETAREALPRDGVATVDAGAHRILLDQVWKAYEPGTLLQSNGLCTMGCALPLAMGAKLAEPGRPVICFTGDGGLEMVLGDLATLRDLGLPVVVVVFVDASLALIDAKQRALGLANAGVDLGTTDFAAVARALGGRGETVSDRAALRRALDEALAADTFSVVACRIDRGAYDGRI